MILYFSATGNCKYVATRIAQSAKQDIVSMVDCIRKRLLFIRNTCILFRPMERLRGLQEILQIN